jgi:hypothetical protein
MPAGADADVRRALERPTDGADDPQRTGYETEQVEVECRTKSDASLQPHELCVHWVETTADAPPLADLNANGVPDQVDATLLVLDEVWQAEVVQMGYRPPLPDKGPEKGQGPSRGTDIYLADVADDGLFGYCAADPFKGDDPPDRAPAYCVIDDDFEAAQFPAPGVSGLDALRVGLAHEFFHAIQFAYEYAAGERFLTEGTATWIEDEVYDGIDANYVYLDDSPLLQPEIPLDGYAAAGDLQDFEYGAWIFWRFLSEAYGDSVVRDVWVKGAPGRDKNPSAIQAVVAATKAKAPLSVCLLSGCAPMSFGALYAEFGAWNQNYPAVYEEGSAYADALGDGSPPLDAVFELNGDQPSTGKRKIDVDHLSVRRIVLDLSGAPAGDRARISVDLPSPARGAQAFVQSASPTSPFKLLRLDRDGKASYRTPATNVAILTLVNASTNHDGEMYGYSAVARP